MTIKLRWKKEPKETGLASVGRDPEKRSSFLRDGKKRYACVSCLSYFVLSKADGWYWVAGWDSDVPHFNSCGTPVADEATAKAQAMAYVKEHLKDVV